MEPVVIIPPLYYLWLFSWAINNLESSMESKLLSKKFSKLEWVGTKLPTYIVEDLMS